jgi:hypothetical protein
MMIRRLPFFRHVNWSPGPRDLRGFAGTMLVGFLILGLVAAWRLHGFGPVTYGLWTAGAAIAVGALLPGVGRLVYLGVYLPTSILGYCISHVLLTLIFFFVFLPVGLAVRLTGHDLLRLTRPRTGPSWTAHRGARGTDSYYRSF